MENRFIRAEDVAQELNVSKPRYPFSSICLKASSAEPSYFNSRNKERNSEHEHRNFSN